MTTVLANAIISFGTSFVGSFACFIIWVHFDLDDRWEQRKYKRHVERIEQREESNRRANEAHKASLRDFHDHGGI